MKIGIDISQIVYGTGVSNNVKNLVINLLKIDRQNQYLLWAGTWREKKKIKDFLEQLPAKANFKAFIHPLPPTIVHFLWNKLHLLPIETLIGQCDIFLSSDWSQPPTRQAKKATIVYDLVPWLYPATQTKRIIKTHKARMKWVKKEADLIFAISQSTKNDLIKIIAIPANKIKVVYPAINKKLFQTQNQKEINRIKKKYQLNDYLLVVGTKEPRKNLHRVINAFKQLEKNNLQLAIVGKTGWGKKNKITKQNNIKILGYVPDKDLPALYNGAKIFLYPSLYEGFGMPILEAQACNCPVITSKTSSMPEVAGNGAILINPKKTNEIKEAIERINNDESLRKELITKGKENVKRFSWKKYATQILQNLVLLKKMLK